MEIQKKPSLEEIAIISQYVDENILQQTEEDTSQFKEKIVALLEYSKAYIKMEITGFEKRLDKENERFDNYYNSNELFRIKEKMKYLIEFQLMEMLVRKLNNEYLLLTKLIHGIYDVKNFDRRTQNIINKYPDYYDYFMKRKYVEGYNIPYAILQYHKNPNSNMGVYELNNEELARFVDDYINNILAVLFILRNNSSYPFIYIKDFLESEFYINNDYDGWAFNNYLFNRNKYEKKTVFNARNKTSSAEGFNSNLKEAEKDRIKEIEKGKAELFLIAYDYLNTFRPKPSVHQAIEKAKSYFEEAVLFRFKDLTPSFEQMRDERENFAESLMKTINGEFSVKYNYSFPEITKHLITGKQNYNLRK